jgi:uncharacterized protein
MIQVPESDCWLHPGVEVRASPISGQGLFARQPIQAGAIVSRLGGRLVSSSELRALFAAAVEDPQRPYIDTITVADDVHLVLPPKRPNGCGNHSCDPNLWWIDAYTLAARRHIQPGDELTNDYATSTGVAEFAMDCACGTALCRRTVTGNDWRIPALRARYADHWVPALLDRINPTPAGRAQPSVPGTGPLG